MHLPTIDFAPPLEPAHFPEEMDEYDWIIFLSPRAVEWSAGHLPPVATKTRIAAPGAGTVKALLDLGLHDAIYPMSDWTSEGLLELPFFSHVAGQKILLVRGEGGRDKLAHELTVRGAKVDQLSVYRRVMPVYAEDHPALLALRQKKIDIMVCTSGESLHNLMAMLNASHHVLLRDVIVVVIINRLVGLAKELGFRRVALAENAGHSAMIDMLGLIKRETLNSLARGIYDGQ